MQSSKPDIINDEILNQQTDKLYKLLADASNTALNIYALLATYTDQKDLASIFECVETNLRATSRMPFLLARLNSEK